MDSDKNFLVEKVAEFAERNLFTFGELERDCPNRKFVIHEGNAYSVERDLQRQAQFTNQSQVSQEKFNKEFSQA